MYPDENRYPEARPIAYLPIARPIQPPVFPHIPLPRGSAALDIIILLVAFEIYTLALSLSGMPEKIVGMFPGVGFLGITFFIGVFALLLVAACLSLRKQPLSSIGLNKPNAVRFWIATAVGLPACYMAAIFGSLLYTVLFPDSFDQFTQERMGFLELVPKMQPVTLLLLSIFVGIHEEVLFRGFLLSRLRSVVRSDVLAIAISSLIFGLGHVYQGYSGIIQTTIIGIALAIIVVSSRTIWPAIIAHAGFDAINLWLAPHLNKLSEQFMQQIPTTDTASAPAAILVSLHSINIW